MKSVLFAFGLVSLLCAQDDVNSWQINASTSALTLASVQNREGDTVFSLKNTSQKTIVAFSVALGRAAAGRESVFDIQEVIDSFHREGQCVAPGASYSMSFPTKNVMGLAEKSFRISSVVFDDGTGDGSSAGLTFITSMRLGDMLETERILSLLGDPGASKQLIGNVPESVDEALSALNDVQLPGVSMDAVKARFSDVTNDIGRQGFLVGVRRPMQRVVAELDRPTTVDSRLHQWYQSLSAKHRDFCSHASNGGLLP